MTIKIYQNKFWRMLRVYSFQLILCCLAMTTCFLHAAEPDPILKPMPEAERAKYNKALHLAAKKGKLPDVRKALAAGADPNAILDSLPPLIFAASNGHADVIKELVSSRADVNYRTVWGESPITLASKNKHKNALQVLLTLGIPQKDYFFVLLKAVKTNDLEMATSLFDSGCDVNRVFETGLRPLHYACMYGEAPMGKLMLDRGADADAPGHLAFFHYMRPFWMAKEEDMAQLLLSHQASTNMPLISSKKVEELFYKFSLADKPRLMRDLVQARRIENQELRHFDFDKILGRGKGSMLTKAVITRDIDSLRKEDAQGNITIPQLMKRDASGMNLWLWPFMVGNRDAALLFMNVSRRSSASAREPKTFREKAAVACTKVKTKLRIGAQPAGFDPLVTNDQGEDALALAYKQRHFSMIRDVHTYLRQVKPLVIKELRAACPAMPDPLIRITAAYLCDRRMPMPPLMTRPEPPLIKNGLVKRRIEAP